MMQKETIVNQSNEHKLPTNRKAVGERGTVVAAVNSAP